MTISTNVWSAQHPNAGRNIQQPDLELYSRAASSVASCTIPVVPTQEAIPEEGGYKKSELKKKIIFQNELFIW